jgi:TolA-binding protein
VSACIITDANRNNTEPSLSTPSTSSHSPNQQVMTVITNQLQQLNVRINKLNDKMDVVNQLNGKMDQNNKQIRILSRSVVLATVS